VDFNSYLETTIILVLILVFFAGFVDAIAGGGGLISIPVLMMAFPNALMPQIFGTNRFSSLLGTATASFHYYKNHPPDIKLLLQMGIPAAIMANIGAHFSTSIPNQYFKPAVIIVLLGVILFSAFNKGFGQKGKEGKSFSYLTPILIGTVIGLYNGLFGPGTGSFLLFGIVSIMGYSLLEASSVAKILNTIIDIASLLHFLFAGVVYFKLAIPMAACNIAGAYVGSKLAIKKGNDFIRYFFLAVSLALVIKLSYDYLH
jgi:uncharacterized protein